MPKAQLPISQPRRWTLTLLAMLAAGVSLYLSWLELQSGPSPLGCGGGDLDCDLVLSSRWSVWFGLPVTVFGAAVYVAVLAALVALPYVRSNGVSDLLYRGLIAAATAAVGSALWFTGLQMFVLHAFCPYCLAIHTCGLLLAVVLFTSKSSATASDDSARRALQLVMQPAAQPTAARAAATTPATQNSPPPRRALGVSAGLLLIAVLIGGQILAPPDTIEVVEFSPVADDSTAENTTGATDSDGHASAARATHSQSNPSHPPTDTNAAKSSTDPSSPDDSPSTEVPNDNPLNDNGRDETQPADDQGADKPADDYSPGDLSIFEAPPDESDPPATSPSVGSSANEHKSDSSASADDTPDSLFGAGDARSKEIPSGGRQLRLGGGRIKLDLDEHIVLGSPDAPYVLVELFDYTCPHCLEMSRTIEKARERYGAKLAVVLINVPLNPKCNPRIPRVHPKHHSACQIARMAYGVWRRRPEQFAAFHKWMFDGSDTRPYGEVRDRVKRLLGQEEYAAAMSDPDAARHIKECVRVFRLTGDKVMLPKMILGRAVLNGMPTNAEHLYELMERYLSIRP